MISPTELSQVVEDVHNLPEHVRVSTTFRRTEENDGQALIHKIGSDGSMFRNTPRRGTQWGYPWRA